MEDIESVSVHEVPTGAQVLDVREDDEWAAGHISGATHVPLGEIPARVGELDPEQQWFVICRSGGRSARAAAWLSRNGVDAVNVDGGMGRWAAVGLPMVSGQGEPHVL